MTQLNPPHSHTDDSSPNSEENSYQLDDTFTGFDDFDGFNAVDDSFLGNSTTTDATTSGKRKGRRPPSTAERRATHNAVERARRESLNGRFMELAGALPSMAQVKRPSKSIIVAKSLEFVYGARAREQALIKQNAALRTEVDELRAQLGMPALPPAPAMPNNMKLDARRARGSVSSTTSGEDSISATSPESVASTLASTPSIQEATSPLAIQQPLSALQPIAIPSMSPSATQTSFNALNLFNAGSPATTPQPMTPALSSSVPPAAAVATPSFMAAPPQMYPASSMAPPAFPMLDFNSPQFNYFSALLQQQADFASLNRQYTTPAQQHWPGFGMPMADMPAAAPFMYA